MLLSLGEIIVFFGLAAYAVYLYQALRVRELALQAARKACQNEGVQLLDDTVSIRRLSLSRDGNGRWRFWRQYRFEYSLDGEERRAGHVIMLGRQLQALVVAEPTLH